MVQDSLVSRFQFFKYDLCRIDRSKLGFGDHEIVILVSRFLHFKKVKCKRETYIDKDQLCWQEAVQVYFRCSDCCLSKATVRLRHSSFRKEINWADCFSASASTWYATSMNCAFSDLTGYAAIFFILIFLLYTRKLYTHIFINIL